MNKYLLSGMLTMTLCTGTSMAQQASTGPGSDAQSINAGGSVSQGTTYPSQDPLGPPTTVASNTDTSQLDGNTTDATQVDGTTSDTDGAGNTQGGNPDPVTPLPPTDGGNTGNTDYTQYYGGDSDGYTTEDNSDGNSDSMTPPEQQPPEDSSDNPPVNNGPTQVTQLPYTISHGGEYSVSPKAVYSYLAGENISASGLPPMFTLLGGEDSITSDDTKSITVDFNGTVIPDCTGSCGKLKLFETSSGYSQETNGEQITLKNLTINRPDTDIYNPRYIVVDGRAQFLTLINVNRGGQNTGTSRSAAVHTTTIFNSSMVEPGVDPSTDYYLGCLTVSDSRYENKEIVVSDEDNEGRCAYHRLLRTRISNSIFEEKTGRAFRVFNGYINNSEFDSIILDMNTSHDFYIGTTFDAPTPFTTTESICHARCGIIDENGVLHWGFAGNENLWLANKRSE